MKYKEAIRQSMNLLAVDKNCRFVGYNVKYSSKANGTLIDVLDNQLIETPVAENLMVGLAIGMSLCGLKPVVYFERFDFILNALDAIVNHLDKIEFLSDGQFQPKVIIRAVIGGRKKPLFTGVTHTQDFSEAISKMVSFPVIKLQSVDDVLINYKKAWNLNSNILLIEERDRYDNEE